MQNNNREYFTLGGCFDKVKYSLLLLIAHMQWPFKTTSPSQSKIFFLKAVIVDCSYAVQ